jgi:hypothetical protein
MDVYSDVIAVTLTTVAGNKALGVLTVPAFKGKLIRATLDLHITFSHDSSAALNYINVISPIIQIDSSGYKTAMAFIGPYCYTLANEYKTINYHAFGAIDIKNYILPNTNYNIRMPTSAALGNNLEIECYTKLKLYFE